MSLHPRLCCHWEAFNRHVCGLRSARFKPIVSLSNVKCYSDQRTSEFNAMSSPGQTPGLSQSQSVHKLGGHQIQISKAQNVTEVLTRLEPLLAGQGDARGQRWQLCLEGKGIRRSFYFKGFKKAWVCTMIALSGIDS